MCNMEYILWMSKKYADHEEAVIERPYARPPSAQPSWASRLSPARYHPLCPAGGVAASCLADVAPGGGRAYGDAAFHCHVERLLRPGAGCCGQAGEAHSSRPGHLPRVLTGRLPDDRAD